LSNEFFDVRFDTDVGLDECGFVPGFANCRNRLITIYNIGHHELGARFRERDRTRPPDPTSGTCNDHYSTLEWFRHRVS
jgi:hypothetical protein